MEIDELIKFKVKFNPDFTDTQREECYAYVENLLQSNKAVLERLSFDPSSRGYAHWDREFNSYQLMIDYMESNDSLSNTVTKAVSYIVR